MDGVEVEKRKVEWKRRGRNIFLLSVVQRVGLLSLVLEHD